MAVTQEQILEALKAVIDPDLHKDLVTLGQVRAVKVFEGTVAVEIATASPHKERLREAVTRVVEGLHDVDEVIVNFAGGASPPPTPGQPQHRSAGAAPQQAPQRKVLGNVKHIVAV